MRKEDYNNQRKICAGMLVAGVIALVANHPVIAVGLGLTALTYNEIINNNEETDIKNKNIF